VARYKLEIVVKVRYVSGQRIGDVYIGCSERAGG